MKQKLELVKIYVLRTYSVSAQIRTHKNAEAVFAHDRLVEDFKLALRFLVFGIEVKITKVVRLEVFDLLFLSSDRFQVHKFRLQ